MVVLYYLINKVTASMLIRPRTLPCSHGHGHGHGQFIKILDLQESPGLPPQHLDSLSVYRACLELPYMKCCPRPSLHVIIPHTQLWVTHQPQPQSLLSPQKLPKLCSKASWRPKLCSKASWRPKLCSKASWRPKLCIPNNLWTSKTTVDESDYPATCLTVTVIIK
jgi:hypothetical protein